MVVTPAGGPNWTDIMTAFGTVGAVVVAFWIALWTDRKSGERIKQEHERADRLLADQRALDKAAIEDERAHGRAQLQEERRLFLEREQLTQAYAVRVMLATRIGGGPGGALLYQLMALVDNKGNYSVRGVEVQFCLGLGGPLVKPRTSERISASADSAQALRDFEPLPERLAEDVLTPWDIGIRCQSPDVPDRDLNGPYIVARWTDRWGTQWEHKRGLVRQVHEGEPWEP